MLPFNEMNFNEELRNERIYEHSYQSLNSSITIDFKLKKLREDDTSEESIDENSHEIYNPINNK